LPCNGIGLLDDEAAQFSVEGVLFLSNGLAPFLQRGIYFLARALQSLLAPGLHFLFRLLLFPLEMLVQFLILRLRVLMFLFCLQAFCSAPSSRSFMRLSRSCMALMIGR
jgi:hypothetical protein